MLAAQSEGRKIISSGNTELDAKMGGGIPLGSLILVEGASGAGKSVLSQQIMWGALQDSYLVTLFTSENTVRSLMAQMQSINLDILDYLLLGKFRMHPMALARLGSSAPDKLLRVLKGIRGRDLIVIDSFTAAISHAATSVQIVSFFEQCKRLCGEGVTIMITLHPDAADHELMNPLRSMCDAHLQLRAEQDGQRLVKTLQVAKVRGASSSTGAIVGFDVEPGWGMRVIPISKARG
ncbi:MAG: flagellar accessory protein FlaH [Chloroflexota bacterium]|nr:flagellar accessory protein FlaH [Chloroflexota bacterium]NOG65720.1 AAA family ATPase [Chloroflexota bacterium]GIK63800.1 MAG: flagellar accessory protein FlaH [Chloroflexota bacterium]